jgi:hypothetical protein
MSSWVGSLWLLAAFAFIIPASLFLLSASRRHVDEE